MTMPSEGMQSAVWGGRRISPQELAAARQTVRLCSGLSRTELARTICEHWGWVTATGSHKATACLKVLEQWEDRGLLRLPGKRPMSRRIGSSTGFWCRKVNLSLIFQGSCALR